MLAAALLAFLRGSALAGAFGDPDARAMYVRLLPLVSLCAGLAAAVLGAARRRERSALLVEIATSAALLLALLPAFRPMSRDGAGLVAISVIAARVAPLFAEVLRGAGARAALVASLLLYGAFGMWHVVGMYAQGDQSHYLLAAEALARGSADLAPVYERPNLFFALSGLPLGEEDVVGHVIDAPAGRRLVQGYGLPALLLPGWALGGRIGAVLVVALVGAAASAQTLLLLRDLCGDSRAARVAWLLVSALAPLLSFAGLIYPNIVAAALIATAFRWLFTAPTRHPALAGVLAGLTLLLTPRDGLAAFLLVPFAFLVGARSGLRYVEALLATGACVAFVNLVAYGVPLPYAGYLYGIAAYQGFSGERTLTFRADTALPGMLFDRAFGIAGTASWAFVGALGVAPLLRARRVAALAALAVLLGSLAALSAYRLWQGGWAPPNRYLVDVLPLWAPFVAAGLVVARAPWLRLVAVLLVLPAALASYVLSAIPTLGYSGDENRVFEWLARHLPAYPLRALPSFAVDDLGSAYARSLLLALGVAALVAVGWRRQARAEVLGDVPVESPSTPI